MDTGKKSSSLCKHYFSVPPCFLEQFHVLTKCSNKFNCLINEMLFLRKLKPSLNAQTDSIRAKVFTQRIFFFHPRLCYDVNS